MKVQGKTGAIFDPTGTYRYSLWRSWDESAPRIGFVMLNPNCADAVRDDPTIRRCIGFARSWNFGGLEVVNLFAYRTAHPIELRRVCDPIGAENDAYLATLSQRVDQIVLAWGNGGKLQNRDRTVLSLLSPANLCCLGMTQSGQPRHPLYLRRDVMPEPLQLTNKEPIAIGSLQSI
jgi:hypothetical protein